MRHLKRNPPTERPVTRKPVAISQHRMDRVVRSARAGIARLTSRATAGKITGERWQQRMAKLLEDKHTRAVLLGRQRSGDRSPLEEDDRHFARLIMGEQEKYLSNLRKAIEDGELSEKQILARAKTFADRLTGTANETFALASPAESEIWWELGGAERHCTDCPEYANRSPYLPEEMPAYPRDGGSMCRTNCLCSLRRNDGVKGFGPTP